MKITFILQSLGEGGSERVASSLANYFVKRNHQVQIIMIYKNETYFKVDPSCKVCFCDFGDNNLNKIQKLIKLRNMICGDYVIAFGYGPSVNTRLATIFSKRKIIVSERTDPNHDESVTNYLKKILKIASFYLSNYCVFQTEGAMEYYGNRIKNKSSIISNPLEKVRNFNPPKERKKIIVTTSRLSEQKNIPLLVDAFSMLHNDLPEYKLVIYGRGHLEASIKKKIDELNLNEYVILAGFIAPNLVAEKIYDASLFVMSSDYEGVSNSLMEALSLGLPVVSTDSVPGGARSLITNGENGYLTEIGNCDELYKTMKLVLENKTIQDRISLKALEINDKNSIESIGEKWLKILDLLK